LKGLTEYYYYQEKRGENKKLNFVNCQFGAGHGAGAYRLSSALGVAYGDTDSQRDDTTIINANAIGNTDGTRRG